MSLPDTTPKSGDRYAIPDSVNIITVRSFAFGYAWYTVNANPFQHKKAAETFLNWIKHGVIQHIDPPPITRQSPQIDRLQSAADTLITYTSEARD